MLFTGERGSFFKTNYLLLLTNSVRRTTLNRTQTASTAPDRTTSQNSHLRTEDRLPASLPLSLFRVGRPTTRGGFVITPPPLLRWLKHFEKGFASHHRGNDCQQTSRTVTWGNDCLQTSRHYQLRQWLLADEPALSLEAMTASRPPGTVAWAHAREDSMPWLSARCIWLMPGPQ